MQKQKRTSEKTFVFSKLMVAFAAMLIVTLGLTPQAVHAAPTKLSAPDLKTLHDSGISDTDNLTQNASPHFLGSCVSGDTVKLYADDILVATGTCASSAYELFPSTAVSNGTHAMKVTATDGLGNENDKSDGLAVTVDTVPPNKPSKPDLVVTSDTGLSQTDNLTNDRTPTFTGTCQFGNVVNLRDNGAPSGELLDTQIACLPNGTYTGNSIRGTEDNADVYAWQIDAAGNPSDETQILGVSTDFTAPGVPGKPDLAADSDTGQSNTDDLTSDTTPTFTGTCDPGDNYVALAQQISLRVDGEVIATGTCVTSTNTYSVTASTVAEGVHDFAVIHTDAAGNVSQNSPALSVTIDTSVSAPAVSGSGGAITGPSFAASGTAEANGVVLVKEGATLLGFCLVNGSGNWSCSPTAPGTSGSHNIDFTTTDIAGNVSSATTKTYTN